MDDPLFQFQQETFSNLNLSQSAQTPDQTNNILISKKLEVTLEKL